jgi:hypothetical protein
MGSAAGFGTWFANGINASVKIGNFTALSGEYTK